MSGAVRISRDIFDDAAFKPEAFTEREAFIWMIMEASFKDREKRIGSTELSLKRGQLAASIRFMANAWRWDESRVRRFLTRLKNRRSIDAANDAGVTVVTICKYNDYQSSEKQIAAPQKQKSPQQRRGGDANENKGEIREVVEPDGSPTKGGREREEFADHFWPTYPNKVGKPDALSKFLTARKTADLETIMAGLRRYIATKPADRNWCNPSTWLNQQRWADEPAQSVVASTTYRPPPNAPSSSYGIAALEELREDLRRNQRHEPVIEHDDGGKILGFEPRWRAV